MSNRTSVYASSRPAPAALPQGRRACIRCGHIRVARPEAILCRDCREVLTTDELEKWAA